MSLSLSSLRGRRSIRRDGYDGVYVANVDVSLRTFVRGEVTVRTLEEMTLGASNDGLLWLLEKTWTDTDSMNSLKS